MENRPYDLRRSLVPAAILHSPLFSPLKNTQDRKIVYFRHERSYQESIAYMGFQLDSDLDFKLYSFILSKSHSKNSLSIVFTRDELFDALNIKFDRDINKFNSLFTRINRFKNCKFVIEFKKEGLQFNSYEIYQNSTKMFNLIEDVVMSADKYSFQVDLRYNMETEYFEDFEKEWVDLNIYSRIKTQRCKAMYLMFLTTKFPNKNDFRISKEKIENRLCSNFKIEKSKIRDKELKSQNNRVIKDTLNELVRLQIINGFDFKNKSDSILFIKSNSLSNELLSDD